MKQNALGKYFHSNRKAVSSIPGYPLIANCKQEYSGSEIYYCLKARKLKEADK